MFPGTAEYSWLLCPLCCAATSQQLSWDLSTDLGTNFLPRSVCTTFLVEKLAHVRCVSVAAKGCACAGRTVNLEKLFFISFPFLKEFQS